MKRWRNLVKGMATMKPATRAKCPHQVTLCSVRSADGSSPEKALAKASPTGDHAASGVPSSVAAMRAPSMTKPERRIASSRPCIRASSRRVSRPSGRTR